jgi:3-phosphoshikimate 1-carboxyvinyltransferase
MKIKGEIVLPGDKSISHRAALFSAIGPHKSKFDNFPRSADCMATLTCLRDLGISWELKQHQLRIQGTGSFGFKEPENILDAKNSGTAMRLLSGILAAQKFSSRIVGDQHLNRRPMSRIITPLRQMGAVISANQDHYPPLHFEPAESLHGIEYVLPVASAQVKSCILLAGLHAFGETSVIETVPTRDHTERMLDLKKELLSDGKLKIISNKNVEIRDLSMHIPGDFSSAAFFIIGALLLPGSECVIKNVSLNPTRTGLLSVLRAMGAQIEMTVTQEYPEPMGTLRISHQRLGNITLEGEIIANIIDEIPVLSILASAAEGRFTVCDAGELRVKETDRIRAVCHNLRALGISVEEYEDGFTLEGPQMLKGGMITTYEDHRIAMAFAIAGLLSKEKVKIDNPDCVEVSFPGFWQELERLTE